ncbi:uncharacterized protein LOC106135508 [Amyelois transitella]|uniref:uncharacterized protein LOC106135508 n=1 Tax=Amyelois transitella TaxID=680683 RepID=UPI0029908274|nr:uncharacterized protein LOC106135508 [Amyelois transitella]
MDLLKTEDQLSDEEIFIGKLSMKEIKRRVLWNKQRETFKQPEEKEVDRSLKIIETHSAPDILHADSKTIAVSPQLKALSNPLLSPLTSSNPECNRAVNDSFLKIEQMVTDLCISTEENTSVTLDNTFDVIDYILKHGAAQNYEKTCLKTNNCEQETQKHINCMVPEVTANNFDLPSTSKDNQKKGNILKTPTKTIKKNYNKKTDNLPTPPSNMRTPAFKTPGDPVSNRKTPHSSLKKPLTKSNIYKHVASPVASYINKCPVVPRLKEIRPSKPLLGHSSIPKLKSNLSKPNNKENVKLPAVAYKSAKKTEVIEIPDEEKLPKSQWAKEVTSSLPRPMVMKHDHREINLAKRMLLAKQENSFADLSLRQADVSVCTQKTAFSRPKKN